MKPIEEEQWEFMFNEESDILHLPGWQKFRLWVEGYGGNKIMQYCFKYSAPYAERYLKHNRKVSFSLVWEQVRDRVAKIREDAKRKGIDLRPFKGFALCNDFRSYAMRFVIHRRPKWDGMFRMSEQGSNKDGRT